MRFLSLILTLLVSACAPIGEMIQHAGQPSVKTVSTTESSFDQAQLESYNGPKARVAVSRFGDQSGKGGGIGVVRPYSGYGWYTPQIGSGMADMLSDALLQSNRFIVLDRQAIQDVLQEQDLAATGRISRQTITPTGEVEGAELLIKGSITEFEPGSAGANAGALLGGFGWTGAAIGGVLGGLRQSHVAMVIQVVDAKTSRILFSTTVEGKANDFNLGGALAGVGGRFLGGAGLGNWQKTPVEKAIRVAIQQAVKEIVSKTPQTYYRHGNGSGVIGTPQAPNTRDPAASVSNGKDRETIRVASSTSKGSSVLPATVTVKVASANIRESASVQSRVVTTVKANSRLSIQAEDSGWFLVQTEDQKAGWISKGLTTH